MYAAPPQQPMMGTEQALMPQGQGLGLPVVNMPPLPQPGMQEGEELLFGIRDEPPSYM